MVPYSSGWFGFGNLWIYSWPTKRELMKSVWTQGTFYKPFEKPIVGHQTHGQGSKKTRSPVNRKKSLKILKTHGTMWVTALVAALWQCIDIFVGLLTCMWEMHSYGCEQNWFYRIWGTDDENSKVRADSRNTIDGFFSSGGRHQQKIMHIRRNVEWRRPTPVKYWLLPLFFKKWYSKMVHDFFYQYSGGVRWMKWPQGLHRHACSDHESWLFSIVPFLVFPRPTKLVSNWPNSDKWI